MCLHMCWWVVGCCFGFFFAQGLFFNAAFAALGLLSQIIPWPQHTTKQENLRGNRIQVLIYECLLDNCTNDLHSSHRDATAATNAKSTRSTSYIHAEIHIEKYFI